jgi:hypothetical protein
MESFKVYYSFIASNFLKVMTRVWAFITFTIFFSKFYVLVFDISRARGSELSLIDTSG